MELGGCRTRAVYRCGGDVWGWIGVGGGGGWQLAVVGFTIVPDSGVRRGDGGAEGVGSGV